MVLERWTALREIKHVPIYGGNEGAAHEIRKPVGNSGLGFLGREG
jgi:hypothetical protein